MNRTRSVILSLFLSMVAVLGTITVTAAPASAASTYEKTATVTSSVPPFDAWCNNIARKGDTVGRVCFWHNGDYLWIRDTVADGAGIWAWAETSPSGEAFKCFNNGGSDVGWQRCGFSSQMNENEVIAFIGYARKNGDDDWGISPVQMTDTSG